MSVSDVIWGMCVGGGHGVWMGVGCPSLPVRNNIVTPRHLFFKRAQVQNLFLYVNSMFLRPNILKSISLPIGSSLVVFCLLSSAKTA